MAPAGFPPRACAQPAGSGDPRAKPAKHIASRAAPPAEWVTPRAMPARSCDQRAPAEPMVPRAIVVSHTPPPAPPPPTPGPPLNAVASPLATPGPLLCCCCAKVHAMTAAAEAAAAALRNGGEAAEAATAVSTASARPGVVGFGGPRTPAHRLPPHRTRKSGKSAVTDGQAGPRPFSCPCPHGQKGVLEHRVLSNMFSLAPM